ncbi:MAG: hypothetical protein J6U40_09720, partial [Kiritimatiellae bacterium]|nr:hypothetical protein [Kiritimatiellia bacterium]
MNSGNSFTALVLSVFTAASASVAILSSFRSGTGEALPIAVSGPEALRRELRAAQAASLPSAVPLTVDAGWRVYTGDEGENAAALAEGLLPAESPDGGTGWPVTVREDPWTRATVFLNAAGDTIGWLPPPEGYDPGWALSTVSCAAFTVTYAYTPDGLDAGYAIACASGTAITRALARDPFRREWVTGITNAVNGVAVKAYALTRDPGGRVTARNGEAYAYSARNELASAVYPYAAYAYAYDEI